MKHGSNSTHPLIFGIGTVECIVAVIKRELVRSVAAQHIRSELQPLKRRLHAAVWLPETRERREARERKEERRLLLIPGFCRACGESRDTDQRKKVS